MGQKITNYHGDEKAMYRWNELLENESAASWSTKVEKILTTHESDGGLRKRRVKGKKTTEQQVEAFLESKDYNRQQREVSKHIIMECIEIFRKNIFIANESDYRVNFLKLLKKVDQEVENQTGESLIVFDNPNGDEDSAAIMRTLSEKDSKVIERKLLQHYKEQTNYQVCAKTILSCLTNDLSPTHQVRSNMLYKLIAERSSELTEKTKQSITKEQNAGTEEFSFSGALDKAEKLRKLTGKWSVDGYEEDFGGRGKPKSAITKGVKTILRLGMLCLQPSKAEKLPLESEEYYELLEDRYKGMRGGNPDNIVKEARAKNAKAKKLRNRVKKISMISLILGSLSVMMSFVGLFVPGLPVIMLVKPILTQVLMVVGGLRFLTSAYINFPLIKNLFSSNSRSLEVVRIVRGKAYSLERDALRMLISKARYDKGSFNQGFKLQLKSFIEDRKVKTSAFGSIKRLFFGKEGPAKANSDLRRFLDEQKKSVRYGEIVQSKMEKFNTNCGKYMEDGKIERHQELVDKKKNPYANTATKDLDTISEASTAATETPMSGLNTFDTLSQVSTDESDIFKAGNNKSKLEQLLHQRKGLDSPLKG